MTTDPDRLRARMDLLARGAGWSLLADTAHQPLPPVLSWADADRRLNLMEVTEQLVEAAAGEPHPVDPDRVRMPRVDGRRAPGYREGPSSPETHFQQLIEDVPTPFAVQRAMIAPLDTPPPYDVARGWHHDQWGSIGRVESLDLNFAPVSVAPLMEAAAITFESLQATFSRLTDSLTMAASFTIEIPVVSPAYLRLIYDGIMPASWLQGYEDGPEVEQDLDRVENTAAGIRARLEQIDAEDRAQARTQHTSAYDAATWSPEDDED